MAISTNFEVKAERSASVKIIRVETGFFWRIRNGVIIKPMIAEWERESIFEYKSKYTRMSMVTKNKQEQRQNGCWSDKAVGDAAIDSATADVEAWRDVEAGL